MSQEIVDAVREIEREKGIESGTLVAALEDALLAAYKKTPGASRHATVELDDHGDFRVYAIELPADAGGNQAGDESEGLIEQLHLCSRLSILRDDLSSFGRKTPILGVVINAPE